MNKPAIGRYEIEVSDEENLPLPEEVLDFLQVDGSCEAEIRAVLFQQRLRLLSRDQPEDPALPGMQPLMVKQGAMRMPQDGRAEMGPGPYHLSGCFTHCEISSVERETEGGPSAGILDAAKRLGW